MRNSTFLKRCCAMVMLLAIVLFGGSVQAEGEPVLNLSVNYGGQTVTVSVTGDNTSGTRYFYAVTDDATAPTFAAPLVDEDGNIVLSEGWTELNATGDYYVYSVEKVADGKYVHFHSYLASPATQCSTYIQVNRYTPPTVTKVASQFQFTVALTTTLPAPEDPENPGQYLSAPDAYPGTSILGGTESLTLTEDGDYTYSNSDNNNTNDFEYYTTYSFRATGVESEHRFPSEAVTVNTARYNLPSMIEFTPFSAAGGIATPMSGHFVSNSPKMYVNYTHQVDPDCNTATTQCALKTPVPGQNGTDGTYDAEYELSSTTGESYHININYQELVIVAAASPTDDNLSSTLFPSVPVTIDTLYSDRLVFHYNDGATSHYLCLTDGVVGCTEEFTYACLWERDAFTNRLYQTVGTTTYYLYMNGNGMYMDVTTTPETGTRFFSRATEDANDPSSYIFRADRPDEMVYFDGSRWKFSNSDMSSDARAKVAYAVKCLVARAGTLREVTSSRVNDITVVTGTPANDCQPTWLAMDQSASLNLSTKPFIIITKYLLPTHQHYSIECSHGQTHDFTYYNKRSYANHNMLPKSSTTEIVNQEDNAHVTYSWQVQQQNNEGTWVNATDGVFTLTQNGSSQVTLARRGNVTSPQRYRLTVTAIYHEDGSANSGIALHGEATSMAVTLIAEQAVEAAQGAYPTIIPIPNDQIVQAGDIFHNGHYYLLRNDRLIDRGVGHSDTAYLSAMMVDNDDLAKITLEEEPERVFIVRQHTVNGKPYYSFEDPALDNEDPNADHLFLTWTGEDVYCMAHPNAIFTAGTPAEPSDYQLFELKPYLDGAGHTYFTLRPKGASEGFSLLPNRGEIATGGMLRLGNALSSHYTVTTNEEHTDRVTARSTIEFFEASRWELVAPSLLPPKVTMTDDGVVTLHDEAGELRGVKGKLYWQTSTDNGETWTSVTENYTPFTITDEQHSFAVNDAEHPMAVGTLLRVWKTAEGDNDHDYFDPSRKVVFLVEQVATPTIAATSDGSNRVIITAEAGTTIHWCTGDLGNDPVWTAEAGPSFTTMMNDVQNVHAYATAPNKLRSAQADLGVLPQLSVAIDHTTDSKIYLKAVVRTNDGQGNTNTTDAVEGHWMIIYTTDNTDPRGNDAMGQPVTPLEYDPTQGIEYVGFANIKAYAVEVHGEQEVAHYRDSRLWEHLFNGQYYTFCYLKNDRHGEANYQQGATDNNFLLINRGNVGEFINSTSLSSYNKNLDQNEQQYQASRTSETYRWMGAATPNTPTYIRNVETGGYLTWHDNDGWKLHQTETPYTQWEWTGEYTGRFAPGETREPCTTCYQLKTTIENIDYYLVFDPAANPEAADEADKGEWRVLRGDVVNGNYQVYDPTATDGSGNWVTVAPAGLTCQKQVAFRTFTVDYRGGQEFSPAGDSLYIRPEGSARWQSVAGEGKQAWASLSSGQSAELRVGFHGKYIHYEPNLDINIVRPEYSYGEVVTYRDANNDECDSIREHDDATFVCWQQWHRYPVLEGHTTGQSAQVGDTAFTHYYAYVSGYEETPVKDYTQETVYPAGGDSRIKITWRYGENNLTAGENQPLPGSSLFTYTLASNNSDVILIQRTNVEPNAGATNEGEPDFSTLLKVHVEYLNGYAAGTDFYNQHGQVFLFAEKANTNRDFEQTRERTRFVSKALRYNEQTHENIYHYLTFDPEILVTTEDADHDYLNGQPVVGTNTEYTQYAAWMVLGTGANGTGPYTIQPIHALNQRPQQLCHRPGNDYSRGKRVNNGLYLYQSNSREAVNYNVDHPGGPFSLGNADYLKFDIATFGPDNDEYVVISPYRLDRGVSSTENVADHLGLANADGDHNWENAFFGWVENTGEGIPVLPDNPTTEEYNAYVNALKGVCERNFWHTRWKVEHAWLTPPDVTMNPDGEVTIAHRIEKEATFNNESDRLNMQQHLRYYWRIGAEPTFTGTVADGGGIAPTTGFAPADENTHLYNPFDAHPDKPTLTKGQTLYVVAVLTDNCTTEHFTYEKHISRPHVFTAEQSAKPQVKTIEIDQEPVEVLVNEEGGRIVAAVITAATSAAPTWQDTLKPGYVHGDTVRLVYDLSWEEGDMLQAVAITRNKLQSERYDYFRKTNLVLEVQTEQQPTVTETTGTLKYKVEAKGAAEALSDYYTLYYTIDGSDPSDPTSPRTAATNPQNQAYQWTVTVTFPKDANDKAQPVTVRAIAMDNGDEYYTNSNEVQQVLIPDGYEGTLTGSGTASDPYIVATPQDLWTVAAKVNGGENFSQNKYFKVTADIDMAGIELASIGNSSNKFQGRFNGDYHVISHLTNALFGQVNNAHIYNVVVDESQISVSSGYAGILCIQATGSTRIYNSGVRSSDKAKPTTLRSTSKNVPGGLVGNISGDARIVNCYNFADITATNADVAGIMGSTENFTDARTAAKNMVFACVNYGRLTTEKDKGVIYPVLGGKSNTALNKKFNIYNYYYVHPSYTKSELESKMKNDGSFGFEAKFLNRFEYVRYILNTKRKHSGWWLNAPQNFDGTANANAATTLNYFDTTVSDDDVVVGKWVLDTTIAPFPIVVSGDQADWQRHPSIINPNYEATWRNDPNKEKQYRGRRLTEWWCADANDAHKGMLKVTVKSTAHSIHDAATNSNTSSVEKWISITDMDTLAYDWNYGKIQLPYYQDVFAEPKISSDDYIVTGWKITSVKKGTAAAVTTGACPSTYNFANREDLAKDIYDATNNPRVFAQGGYYNVPYGVTEIVIEAYWGEAYYVSEDYNDSYNNKDVSPYRYDNPMYGSASKKAYTVTKTTYPTVLAAIKAITNTTGSVYDNAIVLLTDAHYYSKFEKEAQKDNQYNVFSESTADWGLSQPFTLTTIDEDYDNEPDHCLFHFFSSRRHINPMRLDFIPYLDYSMGGMFEGSYYRYIGIFKPIGHFEITETALTRFFQFEYQDNTRKETTAPLILNGGVIEQMVTSRQDGAGADRTNYIQLGGHVWFKLFAPGTHPDATYTTIHCPVTVTGGEYKSFYLTSYLATVTGSPTSNPASFYASGGRIGEYASGGNESIKGNATVKVDHLIVDNFYGGGINETYKITGNIDVTIDSSIVHGIFAAGPKFGSMTSGKTVTASAKGTTFGTYYGAGYGGTSLSSTSSLTSSGSEKPFRFQSYMSYYDRGEYTIAANNVKSDLDKVKGIEIDYSYELMPPSTSSNKYVDRIYIHKASLSMAETYNVSSTLTGCTVKGDFYGGGYVGQVQGTATSRLEGCRVMGNIFAGGNSATVPTARVYNELSNPNDYPVFASGAFLQVDKNEFADYEEYTWATDKPGSSSTWVGTVPTEPTTASADVSYINNQMQIYTNQDLSRIGKCQATDLTVINTIVGTPGDERTGSIYGGGNEAAMEVLTSNGTCSTTVKVEGNTRVYRDVFGAGKHGVVQGGTNVFIGESGESGVNHRPLVLGDIYGGGDLADVQGNTNVTMYDGVTGPIYGGGNEGSVRSTGTGNNIERHNTTINILGGHVGYRPNYPAYRAPGTNSQDDEGTEGTPFAEVASIDIDRGFDIIGDLDLSDNNLKPDIKTVGRPKMYYGVFGGGYGYGTVVSGGSIVNIGGNTMNADVKIYGSVYGGGEAGQVGGGFRTADLSGVTTIPTSPDYYQYNKETNTITKATAKDAVATGVTYYTYETPAWGDATTVAVVPDADKSHSIDIEGAVFGGGRGYFITTVEADGEVNGTESEATQPHAGAVYGNTSVTIGATTGDMEHLHVGSFDYFTDHESAVRYKLVGDDALTSGVVPWMQDLWVFDLDVQRYVPITQGEKYNEHKVAADNNAGYINLNLSENTMHSEVYYYQNTGRVSVAGGGERGAVYGSTAVNTATGLLSNETSRYDSEMDGGNSTVTIHSGTLGDVANGEVNGCVYGAGLSADIDGTSTVTTDGPNAWIRGDVYAGGCMGQVRAYKRTNATETITATANYFWQGWARNVHGGSNITDHGTGCDSYAEIGKTNEDNSHTLVSESVYGANGFSPSDGEAEVKMYSGMIGYVRAGYSINTEKGTESDMMADDDDSDDDEHPVVPNHQDNLAYEGNVYGGGFGPEARVNRTKVTIAGGKIRDGVFGGGELAPVMEIDNSASGLVFKHRVLPTAIENSDKYKAPASDEDYRTTVTVTGGNMSMVLGGGRGYTNFISTLNSYPGTVMGNTKVTISGNAMVRSHVDADATKAVIYSADLGGGNVYGGGLEGEVTGNTTVVLSGGTVQGNVFGGGRGYRAAMMGDNAEESKTENITARASRDAGAVRGNTSVTVTAGEVLGGVYGGGEGLNYETNLGETYYDTVATVWGNATVDISGGTLGGGYTYGASDGHASYAGGRVASVRGYANITISGTANVAAVFGGNDISGKVMSGLTPALREGNNLSGQALSNAGANTTETYVKVVGKPRIGRLFGGGNGKYDYYNDYSLAYLHLHRPVQERVYVDIQMDAKTEAGDDSSVVNNTIQYHNRYIGAAYAGGNQAQVGTAQVTLQGYGLVDSLYGGGNNATVTEATTVEVKAEKPDCFYCNVNQLFGGNNQASMRILPTITLTKGVFGRVFGGGNAGPMLGMYDKTDKFGKPVNNLSTYIQVTSEEVTVREGLYGGCNHARVAGGTYVEVLKTSKQPERGSYTVRDYGIYQLFGGNDISDYVANSRLDVIDGVVHNIYGGGNGHYNYVRNNDRWNAYLYGSKNTLSDIVASYVNKQPYVGKTQVNIWGGDIRSAIYGGGYAGDCGETHVVVNDTVGQTSASGPSSAKGGAKSEVGSGKIGGVIYGGGLGNEDLIYSGAPVEEHVGNVDGTAYVDLYHIKTLEDAKAYGGGKSGNVGNTLITVHPDWDKPLLSLYGGCWGGDVTGMARVVMNCRAVAAGSFNVKDLYGGNDYSGTVHRSVLTVNDGRYDNVYGAGNGDYNPTASLVYAQEDPVTGTVHVPNSQFPVINFNNGYVMTNMYGGGNLGTCQVLTTGQTTLDDYAFVQVNVHGGEFMNNIFAGASGKHAAKNTPPLIVGLKQLNMDNGLVHQSVYGGTESLDDGYKNECDSIRYKDNEEVWHRDTTRTTRRPSSVMNLVGGTVKNNVYGGGYLGNVYGSVYVNIGEEAVKHSRMYERKYRGGATSSTAWSSYNVEGVYKPRFTENAEEDTSNYLMKHALFLERSVYNGANWGDAESGYIFNTRGFMGGESRILVDGLGYNTSSSDEGNSDPAMDIRYSLIGAGTSCEGGDVHRDIRVYNYGNWEDCNVSKELWSIQRADSVEFHKAYLALTGDQDAYTAYASTRYSMNRCDTILFKGENVVRIDQPVINARNVVFRNEAGELMDNVTEGVDQQGNRTVTLTPGAKLSTMKSKLGTVCTNDCAKVTAVLTNDAGANHVGYTSLLVNNGAYVDVFYKDESNNIHYGNVEGYGYLRAEDQTQAIVTARYKTTSPEVDVTDGGFFSLCPDDNVIASETDPEAGGYDGNVHHGIDGGRRDGSSGVVSEFNYGNYNNQYRAWKLGQGKRLRHITITAHQDLKELPEQNKWASENTTYTDAANVTYTARLAVAKATLELPPTENGNYYTITGGILVDQENREMDLVGGALLPGDYTQEGQIPNYADVYASTKNLDNQSVYYKTNILTTQTWVACDGSTTVADESKGKLLTDPSHNFGLLITGGAPLIGGTGNNTAAIYSNTYFTGTNGYQTKTVTGETSNVMPTLDFFLTYNPEFKTTLMGDVQFTLQEIKPVERRDPNNQEQTIIVPEVVGTVDVIVSISTVVKDMRPQELDLVAIHNEFDNHEYSRKLVLPASLVRRNLYLTSVKWEPTPKGSCPSCDGYEYIDASKPGNFYLQDASSRPTDTSHFALRIMPTEDLSASLATTLGWNEIGDNAVIDLYQVVYGNGGGSAAYSAKTNEGFQAVSLVNSTTAPEGLFMGVLDGRSSAGMDITLFYNGDLTYSVGRKGKATLHFEYYNQNTATSTGKIGDTPDGGFDLVLNVVTRDRGDTIYMASANTITRDGITLKHWDKNTHTEGNHYNPAMMGREPIQYVQTFAQAMSLYQAGDVICILDEVILAGDENDVIHGTDYNFVPVVRYSGNHCQFPGKKCAYRGTMIRLQETAKLTTDHMIFDGSMVSKWKETYATAQEGHTDYIKVPFDENPYGSTGALFSYADMGWHPDTLKAYGPIFDVRDNAELTLSHKTTVQNNWNAYTGANGTTGLLGGAIRLWNDGEARVTNPNPKLVLNNTVVLKNILTDANVTGAVHMEDGTFTLGSAKTGTAIHVENNYHNTGGQFWSEVTENASVQRLVVDEGTTGVKNWAKANVYLAREGSTTYTSYPDSALHDSKNCIINFSNELSANTRVGISKVFPGKAFTDDHSVAHAAVRDTIMVAQVTGTHQQYMRTAYQNGNFFNDGRLYGASHSEADTFFHEALRTHNLFLQRCATFQKQLFADEVTEDEVTHLVRKELYGHDEVVNEQTEHKVDVYQQPVLRYLMNERAACPNGTDTAVFSVWGGCYPYTYQWVLNDNETIRTYTTPYAHDKVLADATHAKAIASNSDSALLAKMELDADGAGGEFKYTAIATDLFGCQQKKSFTVTMSRKDNWTADDKPLVLTDPIDKTLLDPAYDAAEDTLQYAWMDTVYKENNVENIEAATRKFRAVNFEVEVLADAGWGTVEQTLNGTTTTVTKTTPLCPGDAIHLNAQGTSGHKFIQWGFDPYDSPQTVFVMPNTTEGVKVQAYFGPTDYWKDEVKYWKGHVDKPNDKPGVEVTESDITVDYYGNWHVKTANGLAWVISLCNGLNGVQARTFFFDTIYLDVSEYDMSAHLWTPLGTSQHPFRGVLKPKAGVSPVIKGIIVNEPSMSRVGFFGYLDSATVDGITIQKSHLVGQQYVGALVGEATNCKITGVTIASKDEDENTTMITANYASGGMAGKAENTNITGNTVAARYMGATIYNGGVVGYGKDVTIANAGVVAWPRMSSLYSGGTAGYIESTPSGSKDARGSRIVNNYVHLLNANNQATRTGGLVGRASNTLLANNYVYGEGSHTSLSGALGAVLENGVKVENCFYEQGFDRQAVGYSSYLDTTAVTTFRGTGYDVVLADTLGGNYNLTRQLNRWVYAHGGGNLHFWHADLADENNGYPLFGDPDYQPLEQNREASACDSYLVDGTLVEQGGVYYYHVVDSAEFTDTLVTLNLTLNYGTLTELLDTLREDGGYAGHGFHLSATEVELLRQSVKWAPTTVVLTDTLQTVNGCDSVVTLYLTLSGNGEPVPAAAVNVKVYPNPTTRQVTVEGDGLWNVEVYDATSRKVRVGGEQTTVSNSITVDLEGCATGVYYLRIKTESGVVIERVIKK